MTKYNICIAPYGMYPGFPSYDGSNVRTVYTGLIWTDIPDTLITTRNLNPLRTIIVYEGHAQSTAQKPIAFFHVNDALILEQVVKITKPVIEL